MDARQLAAGYLTGGDRSIGRRQSDNLGSLTELEYSFTDSLFIWERPVDKRIKIIGIDEDTLWELGSFSGWTRQPEKDFTGIIGMLLSGKAAGFM